MNTRNMRNRRNTSRALSLGGTVLLLIACAGLAACSSGPSRVQGIRIANAIYGVQGGTVPCDVTSRLGSICNGLSTCTVLAQSRLCPMGDPTPTQQKHLAVEYACGGGVLKAAVRDGQQLTLSCAP